MGRPHEDIETVQRYRVTGEETHPVPPEHPLDPLKNRVRCRRFEEAPDIGMVGLEVRDGRIADVLPQIVYPTLEAQTWRP